MYFNVFHQHSYTAWALSEKTHHCFDWFCCSGMTVNLQRSSAISLVFEAHGCNKKHVAASMIDDLLSSPNGFADQTSITGYHWAKT
jgi:hypothetical protein